MVRALANKEFTTMKTLLLASMLALTAGAGIAFASVTTYTDGSTYDSATGLTTAPAVAYAMTMPHVATDAPVAHRIDGVKVVRWGPPEGRQGGA
jgi:hypothetical protein